METGRIIGQYVFENKIGEGGMAEVWQARHAVLGSIVAIKFLSPRIAGEPDIEARFLNEGKRQAQLKHPNIVSATDFLQVDGHSYLVMQFVEGENLEHTIGQRRGPLNLEEVHGISWDVLSALDYAHAHGVVHRDVKPSNILLENAGRVYLTDFGIALALAGGTRFTTVDIAIGTADYMSPEQITRPKLVDHRADIYGFGCVLYAMLTGAPPFGGGDDTDYYVKDCHVHNAPPPMRIANPSISPDVEAVVLKCLEKDPAARYQTCGDVMRALDAAIGGKVQSQYVPAHNAAFAAAAGLTSHQTMSPLQTPTGTPVVNETAPRVVQRPPERSVKLAGNKRNLLLAAVLLFVVAAGYGYYNLYSETVFRMEGSTTVGLALAPDLVQKYLESEGGTDIKRDVRTFKEGTQDVTRYAISARMPGKARRQDYVIVANGSSNAFAGLDAGRTEIGMASRPVNDTEYQRLLRFGDFHSFASENVVALDGIAVIVNHANPIQSLTRSQIGDIYRATVTDWAQVNGKPGPIHLFSRDNHSGTYDSFVSMVLSGDKKAIPSSASVKENGEQIADAVTSDADAIGYVALAQVGGARALAVSDGRGTAELLPNTMTVATEDYILSRRLFLYTPPNTSPGVSRFVRFALSAEGQEVVKKVGYVPLEATLESVPTDANAPADYRSYTAGKQRMRLDFRFEPNSYELDTKALADISRAASILAGGRKVALLGFADGKGGTFKDNKDLSLKRALVVAKQFSHYGVSPGVYGLSWEMPVGNNETAEGREKNRRVEVWVL